MRYPRLGVLATIAAVALVSMATVTARAQEAPDGDEPSAAVERLQSRTDEGDWHGTWTYLNRDEKMMLWIDEKGDRLRVRVQYYSMISPEAFLTDWDGNATFELAGEPGTFHMDVTYADADRIEGTWLKDIQFQGSGRSERGVFTLYRVGDGRQASIDFSEYERVLRKGEKVSRYSGAAMWNFKKVSKRLALWQEVF